MGWKLILFVMVIYAWISYAEFSKGNYAMGVVFFGYSLSNVGLAWLSWVTSQ
jgi:hypothetical protein